MPLETEWPLHIVPDGAALTDSRVREIVREELAWAMKLGAQVQPANIMKTGFRRGRGERDTARYRILANRYEEGASIEETASEFGCCVSTVRKAIEHCGVDVRRTGPRTNGADTRVPEMMQLRSEGKTLEEIGAHFRVTRERVRQIFKRAGVDTSVRPLTESERAAVERYAAGDSLNLAAESLGVSAPTMRNLILRAGHTVRRSPRKGPSDKTLANAARAAALYLEGKKTADIAAQLGLPAAPMVYRLLAIAGVKPSRVRRA